MKNIKSFKDMNSGYNTEVVPKKFSKKVTNPLLPNLMYFKEIGIGERDPIKKFREWNGQYWLNTSNK